MSKKFELNKRYLVQDSNQNYWDDSVTEVKVLEISKTRVKLQLPSGAESWELSEDYKIVEELK